MKITRKMVAEKAGVTPESVSYVLNKSRPVSDEIVKKVMDAVEELGYVPDMMARTLANKSSNSIGIICNDISNPYYSDIIFGIQEAADEKGISVIVADAKLKIIKNIHEMVARRVDGICFLVFPYTFDGDYSPVNNANVSMVVTHNTGFDNKNIPHIEPDFEMGIKEALLYLKEKGHKKIAYLSAFDETVDFDNRRTFFDKYYREIFNETPNILHNAGSVSSTIETGKILAEKLVKQNDKTTAIICTNDLMAIGAIEYFNSVGVKVPDDISVIGIDDMMFSSIITPKLTTIGYDKKAFGRSVFEILYKNIKNKTVTNKLFPLKLVKRDSVKELN